MIRATKETEAGRRYLDLPAQGQAYRQATGELNQLYALEALEVFLDRLARSAHADRFVLKDGVLLATLDARRPTRDIDLAGRGLENSADQRLLPIREISAIAIDDGLFFDAEHATAETIRDDEYASTRRGTSWAGTIFSSSKPTRTVCKNISAGRWSRRLRAWMELAF